jgi:hypothetical protein
MPRSFESSAWMICTLFLLTFTTAAVPASADVLISVNKSTQQMSVSVDGVPRHRFAVSTGRAGYGTPNGTYHPQRLAASWFSKLYYNSPMPHSIFFHGGYAIHGSNPVRASSPGPSPRRFGGRERPSYADRYRSDYGQASNNYYWRPEPRFFPSFNSY